MFTFYLLGKLISGVPQEESIFYVYTNRNLDEARIKNLFRTILKQTPQ